jgi:hypothetical protein
MNMFLTVEKAIVETVRMRRLRAGYLMEMASFVPISLCKTLRFLDLHLLRLIAVKRSGAVELWKMTVDVSWLRCGIENAT